jgi:hypothetical protein
MKSFRTRRWTYFIVTLVAAALLAIAWVLGHAALRPVPMYSGALLLALIVGLLLFNARKKLPFIPLLKASTWLQVHVYAGWLTVLVYGLHVGFRWPSGRLGLMLAALFFCVSVSGVVGLWLSRWLPPRLTRSGESLIYERIPLFRHRLQVEAREAVHQAATEANSTTLEDFYLRLLGPYLASQPWFFLALAGDDPKHHRVKAELAELRRYLDPREVAYADQLGDVIEAKRGLDFQLAGQRLLKLWLFVHIPLSYALLILCLVHAWLALRYAGRW